MVLILTVEVIVVVSTLQLLFNITSILLKTVLIFVVISVVVVGVVVVRKVVDVVIGGLVGTDCIYSSDMMHDSFIELPAL